MSAVKFAVSNIALTAYDHAAELRRVAALGISGIEVAPSRVWKDSYRGLRPSDVARYKAELDAAGLEAVGLHSLFFDQPSLGLFRDPDGRAATLDFLVHLSGLCRDLGGRTLIWGGGRKRGSVPAAEAVAETIGFMGELCRRIEGHGTVFCFEPLGPESTDFINSALESLAIAAAVDHPALAVQLDAKALYQNDEVEPRTFASVAPRLVHFHANEPDLGVLGSSGLIDHARLGALLREQDYRGFVSIEQRQIGDGDPVENVARSYQVLERCYGE